jgi:hypothetical protein
MYAECAVRGAGGSIATAATYVNALRTRANGTAVTQGDLTLDFILDERARELHFEGQRRTDLIRLVNSQEEVIYGHGKVGCWWISNTIV